MATDVELVTHVLQVGPQFIAQTEVLLPVIGGERERVEMVGGVDAGAGIAVLQPHATDRGVSLAHLEVDAGHLQVDGGTKAGDSSSDDQNLEVFGQSVRLVIEELDQPHLGCGELAVFGRHVLAHRDAEHANEQFVVGVRQRHGPAGLPRLDRLERGLAHLVLVCGQQATGVVVAHAALSLRVIGSLQPVGLPRQLNQHHQQRGNVGDGDRLDQQLFLRLVWTRTV